VLAHRWPSIGSRMPHTNAANSIENHPTCVIYLPFGFLCIELTSGFSCRIMNAASLQQLISWKEKHLYSRLFERSSRSR
jgi:hypothetical protein